MDRTVADIFISHAWRYHDEWTRLSEVLNGISTLSWRNFSVPWYDPAMDPNTEVGREFVHNWLEGQVIPSDVVFILFSVYSVKSARRWLDLELELAKAHGKVTVGLPAGGQLGVPAELAAKVDMIAYWDPRVLIHIIREAKRQSRAGA